MGNHCHLSIWSGGDTGCKILVPEHQHVQHHPLADSKQCQHEPAVMPSSGYAVDKRYSRTPLQEMQLLTSTCTIAE